MSLDQQQVFSKIVGILTPFVKSSSALATVNMETSIMGDLKVNSARLVDIVLEIEDAFGIEVPDDDADRVRTVGDAVGLVMAKNK